MHNWYILEQSFIFIFFSDHRTLKFLEMKCNPTNKKVYPKDSWSFLINLNLTEKKTMLTLFGMSKKSEI